MLFETSVSINESIKNNILEASSKTGKSACFISKLLIKKAIKLNKNISVLNQLTEYQKSENLTILTKFRYRLSESERIKFSNARQRLNVSVSMLLLVGYVLFFDDLVNELCNKEVFQNSYTIIFIYSRIQIVKFLKKIDVNKKWIKKLE